MTTVRLARQAMATRFEIVLYGDNAVSLRAAGEEALQEVERLDARLSLYRPDSEIAHVNAHAAGQPVRVSLELFSLLELAQRLSEETAGAFDITIAPVLRCWGFMDGHGSLPDREKLDRARTLIGMHRVSLDAREHTVAFEREGVMLDLGAIGKGFAVEQAAETLKEAGVVNALVHGGTSTIYALGHPPDAEHWKVAIEKPPHNPATVHHDSSAESANIETVAPVGLDNNGLNASSRRPSPGSLLATFALKNEALSVSAVWGKSFQAGGKTFGHVLDPRTGHPAGDALLSAVMLPSGTETDALSTALLVLGREGHEQIHRLRTGMKSLLLSGSEAGFRVETRGLPMECSRPTAPDPETGQEAR